METLVKVLNTVGDIADDPVIKKSGSGLMPVLMIGAVVIAALLIYVLFFRAKKTA